MNLIFGRVDAVHVICPILTKKLSGRSRQSKTKRTIASITVRLLNCFSYVNIDSCSRYFQGTFDLLILVNAVCIGLNQEKAEWFFLAAFTVEIILKLYAYAPKKYFTAFWNV